MDDTPQQNDWEVGNDCFYEDMKRTLAHQRQPRVFPMMNIDIWGWTNETKNINQQPSNNSRNINIGHEN